MHMLRNFTRILAGAAGLAAVVAALPLRPAAAQALPDARAVLDKFAEATGSKALEAAPGLVMRGTVELPAAGLSGTVISYLDKTGRSAQVMSISGVGDMSLGSDADFAWSMNAVEGPRVLTAREYAERQEQESIAGMLRKPDMVTAAQTLARTTLEGQACVQLMLTWKSGRKSTECFSESTGLLVSVSSTQTSQAGALPYVSAYSNYKSFGGITLPTKLVQRVAGQEFIIQFSEIKVEAVDPTKLAVPAEVRALRR